MGKRNKHQSDNKCFGRWETCMEVIPVEYYSSVGDQITCYECETEYILENKNPVILTMLDSYQGDDYYGELRFDD